MIRRLVLFTLFALVPGIALAQQGAASPIDGVWRITETSITGDNPSTDKSPQPSLIIFARGHYSWLSLNGATPRKQRAAPSTPGKPTDAEKIAAYDEWQPFIANAGTYEIKGTAVTRRRLVAKNVSAMAPVAEPVVEQFKLEGDTLWITSEPPNAQGAQTRFRLTRVR
jgi:hypothetical protein